MRIYLAGECHIVGFKAPMPDALVAPLMGEHPYRLVSYYYMASKKDPPGLMKRLVSGDQTKLLVDSGIFTFAYGAGASGTRGAPKATYESYRDYVRKYLDDMADWGMDRCLLVECDAHQLLSMEETFRLREEFAPLGSRCMYVWHRQEGLDGLDELARKVDYIGLGIREMRNMARSIEGAGRDLPNQAMNALIARIHRVSGASPPRIHLLGCTATRMLESRLAWSCDSTSWLGGVRFGNGYVWTAQNGLEVVGLRSKKFKRFAELTKDTFPKAVDFIRKRTNQDYYYSCMTCAYAFSLYQKSLDSRYTAKAARGDALPGGPL